MVRLVSLVGTAAVVLFAGCSSIPGGKDADDSAAFHPASAVAMPAPVGYDQQMRMMQEMHQKMAAAKTPEERAALMRDQMKTMQDGMAMMSQMGGGMMGGGMGMSAGKGPMGGGMPMDADMMKRRLDMMEMMMQMMMDREGMKPPSAR